MRRLGRRRAGLLAGGTALAVWLGSPDASADSLADLLSSLGPGSADTGRVDVRASVEASGTGSELVISLLPVGDVKLVADPGITVLPLPSANVRWQTAGPVRLVLGGAHYFDTPPTLRLPFAAQEGLVGAKVDYAYCIVDEKCLFGEAAVSVPVTPTGG